MTILLRADSWPDRVKNLPIDPKTGYPVPFFVGKRMVAKLPELQAVIDAYGDLPPDSMASAHTELEWDFRIADENKKRECIKRSLCWVCGEFLGSNKVFVCGPVTTITRTHSEPPCHKDCAEWATQICPFLAHANKERREKDLPEGVVGLGEAHLKRNPKVTVLWCCKKYKTFRGNGSDLIEVGEPEWVQWIKEGRPATREECIESVDEGLEKLQEMCDTEDDFRALAQALQAMQKYYPEPELPRPLNA